ncbi:MAG TPA: hypothetical protein PK985_05605 [Bacillota bacterium]|nr:hypothetical protein [Bacillota bacterium]
MTSYDSKNFRQYETTMQERPKPGKGGLLADEIILAKEEARHIRHMRELKWGQLTVIVKDGKPVMSKNVSIDVKYTD